MTSIRGFLIATLLAVIVLSLFVSVYNGFHYSSKEIQQQMDEQLIDLAKILSQQANANPTAPVIQVNNRIAYQIIQSDNKPEKPAANKALLASLENVGKKSAFGEENFDGFRWRTYVLHNSQKQLWVIVAERIDIRLNLSEKIILKSLYSVIWSLPLMALLIWLLVGYALKPLSQLAGALKNKPDDNLSTLKIATPYQEVEQVVHYTNSLLKRLTHAFEREKHFASDVAHELRTPLSVLKLDVFNLNKTTQNKQELITIKHSVERMERLIQQILTLYQTTPDKFIASFSFVDLHTLCQNVIAEHYPQFEKKSQSISLHGDTCLVEGDPSALSVLIINLIDNANKYTPKGGSIKLTVCYENNTSVLQVEDSGPGIDESQHERIFDRFYRLKGDCHASGEAGCGLGFSIIKHIVDMHQATIKLLAANFKSGLLVRIEFPRRRVHEKK